MKVKNYCIKNDDKSKPASKRINRNITKGYCPSPSQAGLYKLTNQHEDLDQQVKEKEILKIKRESSEYWEWGGKWVSLIPLLNV